VNFSPLGQISPKAKTFNHLMRSFRTCLFLHCNVVTLQCTLAMPHEKSLVLTFFKVSVDHLYMYKEINTIFILTKVVVPSLFVFLVKEKRGLALDGQLKYEDTNLASSTM